MVRTSAEIDPKSSQSGVGQEPCNGSGSAGASKTGVVLSTNTTISKSDTKIGEYPVGPLAAGASHSQGGSYPVPLNFNGTYYVGAIADWYDQISETNDTNNALRSSSCSNGSLTVNTQGDLELISVTHSPCSVSSGGSISVTCQVRNNGPGSTGASMTGIYLSKDTAISTSDTKIGEYPVGPLSAGSTHSQGGSYPVTIGLDGTFYVGAIADWNNQVSETNEGNNALRSSSCNSGSLNVLREAYLYASHDMIVASGLPNDNFCNTIWDTHLGLGEDNGTCIWPSPAGQIWSYIRFDVSNTNLLAAGVPSIFHNSLLSADFEWFKVQGCNTPYGAPVKLEANSTGWSPCSITWGNQTRDLRRHGSARRIDRRPDARGAGERRHPRSPPRARRLSGPR